ncbi:MAG TPA: plasmid stabilization protein [Roseiarcus sp.]|jgi:plasmid stability protein
MASLLVRGLDDELVKALKARAVEHGHSAKAEHRLILKEALEQPRRRSFAEILASMPDVGRDDDFEHEQSNIKAPDGI